MVALAIGALACGAPRRAWRAASAPRPSSPAAYAVVNIDRPVFLAPDRRAPTVSLRSAAGESRRVPWASPSLLSVRALRQRGEWVEIETLGESDARHCANLHPVLEGLRLRYYVPSDRIATIVSREVRQSFDDETSIVLRRGVPVFALESRRRPEPRRSRRRAGRLFRVHLGAVSIVLRLGDDEVGTRYLPSEAASADVASGYVISGSALGGGRVLVGQTGRLESDRSAGLAVRPVGEPRDGRRIVSASSPCGTIRASASESDLVSGAAHVERGVSPGAARALVPPGTEVTYRGGQLAGVTTAAVEVRAERGRDGPRRCFSVPIDVRRSNHLELCFGENALREPIAGVARALGDPRPPR